MGLAAIVFAIVGRAWCSLYIGGRKKAEIVSRGPYSISRNPLYIFSFFGAFGVGAQSGSLTLAVLFTLASVAVFYLTVRREEAWLGATFGAAYADYKARTPRFLPDFSLWRDEPELSVRPNFFLTTIRDGLVFLLAIPLFEAVDLAQAQAGWLRWCAYLIGGDQKALASHDFRPELPSLTRPSSHGIGSSAEASGRLAPVRHQGTDFRWMGHGLGVFSGKGLGAHGGAHTTWIDDADADRGALHLVRPSLIRASAPALVAAYMPQKARGVVATLLVKWIAARRPTRAAAAPASGSAGRRP